MRVIHVVPEVANQASGLTSAVPRLCEALIQAGTDAEVAALEWTSTQERRSYVSTFPLGAGPRRLGVSPLMRRWLEMNVSSGQVDVIHNHSLWMMPNVYAGRACRRGCCQLIVSPHGTLSKWALDFHPL